MEQELIDIVIQYGEREGSKVTLDVEDINMRWSYWDDNEKSHEDWNVAYTRHIEKLVVDEDCNGCHYLSIIYDDDERETFTSVNYEDEDGNNMAGYIHEEVCYYYDIPF